MLKLKFKEPLKEPRSKENILYTYSWCPGDSLICPKAQILLFFLIPKVSITIFLPQILALVIILCYTYTYNYAEFRLQIHFLPRFMAQSAAAPRHLVFFLLYH